MRIVLSIIFLSFLTYSLQAQSVYSKVRIDLSSMHLDQLSVSCVDLSEGFISSDHFLETDLSSKELLALDQAKVPYEIIYKDVTDFYTNRARETVMVGASILAQQWPVPEHWELGSMGGFYTLSEVMDELDEMRSLYPNLITIANPLSETNLTFEGRKQYWVRISDNPETNEDEPEILYTAMHHAREPMSMQQLLYYMWYLLENYETDGEIQRLINQTEMYFIPVINPDGHAYNQQTNPDGGGMWRKNRRDNGNGEFGVDLNRNYSYKWGYNDAGSSPNPSDNNYRGSNPFSEPETQNIRDFCKDYEFKLAMNYHSYGSLLLYPWGYMDDPCGDDELFADFSELMTKENHYRYGPGNTTIYPTNGASDDWMYGEVFIKDIIYGLTPEVGGSGDGYWPSNSRILSLCQEQMWQNLSAARLVGKYAVVSDQSPLVIGDLTGFLPFEIKRLGLTDSDLFTVSIQALDAGLTSVGPAIGFEQMSLMEIAVESFAFTLDENMEVGASFRYLLTVDHGDYTVSDTIERFFGEILPIFADGCDDMTLWSSETWGITTQEYYSEPASITDSPNEFYQNSDTAIILLDSTIDLSGVSMAFAQFWAMWDIESDNDYVQFQLRELGTEIWQPLEGEYTKPGSTNQVDGEPVYDGYHMDWRQETISLADYTGKKLQFRFVLLTNNYMREDGFYFDDFAINIVSSLTAVASQHADAHRPQLFDAFPNPGDGQLHIPYQLTDNHSPASIEIINLMGKKLIEKDIRSQDQSTTIDISELSNGLYLYRITTSNNVSIVKRFIKH